MTPAGYFEQLSLNGQCFIGATPIAGVAVPAANSTAPLFGLWNPAGSGVNLVLNRLMIGVAGDGTNAFGAFALAYTANTGSQAATGSPITVYNQVSSVNALVSAGPVSKAKFTNAATNTLTAAGTVFYPLGFGAFAGDLASTALPPVTMFHDFGGGVVIPQGTFVHLVAAASTVVGLTCAAGLTWAEIPV